MRIIQLAIIIWALLLMQCSKPYTSQISRLEMVDSILNAPYVETVIASDMDSNTIGTKLSMKGRVTNVDLKNKRCLLTSGNLSIRLDAKGNVIGFNKELIGMDIYVYGTLRERRYYLRDLRKAREKSMEIIRQHADSICERQINEIGYIDMMEQWINSNNRPYYSIMSFDCEEYAIL